ncbi:MAG TPA: ATP-dependent Clp protease ATP-binding subunit [Candidatus Pacearchaeota archaeon]|nr:ATP-dependent Clp protease ATP-binding subunit [Candidatus Pacearchaeota archaeon]HRR94563.1 ATP-dependent Clp protease ATP-binding subunit [Candidatus Paceibacterota bacterium]HQG09078.1 ATP-dependent Clp protease ATP-binding subunit [Candidatus Pacearchaeota archaeon]HQH20061.1 ATP-dependent Clp protease ATP-binding subunit [Candidatus Pacearchaeota archaeon]HQK58325.1 ATP-dependent Clp protease ATP-binding subunit [Candidatus Pacearchaeota archaeon]
MFNLKQTEIYQTIQSENNFRVLAVIKNILLILFIVLILIFLLTLNQNLPSSTKNLLLGIGLIIFSLWVWLQILNNFFEHSLKKPIPSQYKNLAEAVNDKNANLAEWLNYNSAKAIVRAFKQAEKFNLSTPTSTILLYELLDEKNQKIIFIFGRTGLSFYDFKDQLEENIKNNLDNDSDKFDSIIFEAVQSSLKRKGDRIKEGDLLAALADIEPLFQKTLISLEMGREDIENISWWIESINTKIKKDREFGSFENLIKYGSIGSDLSYGYTVTLDKFAIDWSSNLRQRGYEEVIGHNEEVELTEKILTRKGPRNVLLVGEAGVGRKNIIHTIIRKSIQGQCSSELNYKRFLQLDLVALSASVNSLEDTEAVINQCFKEALSAGNVVLILNDFHDFLGAERKAGITDISGILTPYLSDPRLQLICLTTPQGLHKYIEAKPAILNLFEKVEVPELSPEETMLILENMVFGLEKEYEKFITYQALKEIIEVSGKYVSAPFPQKAISLLQDAFTYSSKHSDIKLILPEHIDEILSQKTKIPLGRVKSQEKEILLNLESALHKRVISQDEAIREISSAMRRARAGINTGKGPMGSFLFLGPTGVGKTETAKALAEIYFGSEDRMIRLDMSEFQRVDDIPRLLGSETQNGILTTAVRDNPFSLVLLDEIEKAYPDILNLFLQVLDEGYINDNFGVKVSFSNTIIIATSNAGYKVILEALKLNKQIPEIKKDLLDYIFANNIFRPEFINRFDGVIVFKSLTQSDLFQIAQLQLNKIAKNLKSKKINFIITEELTKKVAILGFNPIFGAREMNRIIQDKVENIIAQALLADKIGPGSNFKINPNTFSIELL